MRSIHKIYVKKLGRVTHACNPRDGEAETDGSLRFYGQPDLMNYRLEKDWSHKSRMGNY